MNYVSIVWSAGETTRIRRKPRKANPEFRYFMAENKCGKPTDESEKGIIILNTQENGAP